MPAFLLKRLLQLLPVLLIASFLLFVLVHLMPGDPALILAGGHRTSTEVLQSIRERYHLQESLPAQYLSWAGHALSGDLGESYRLKQSVGSLIWDRLGLTASLIALSMVLALMVSIPLGVLSALKKDTWIDRLVNALALAGLSSPVFLTGILGILVFSYTLGWLPSLGAGSGPGDTLRHLILPASALALNMIALSLRVTRNGMIAALDSPWLRSARMKGLSRARIILVHALKNALVPLLTISGMQIGFLLTGTVLVEYTFGLGGLGSLLVDAVQSSDFPLIQGITLFVIVSFMLINLGVDILCRLIDPRLRHD